MASLIKNQILKHLAKFTKNLSPDKIQISTLKGEGALSNLELNADLLMNIMELPLWLRLNKAVCNKVQVKIQWTKLKSEPIRLYLDEVVVEMETCADLRTPNEGEGGGGAGGMPQMPAGGKYGFTDRVIDGIFLSINSIHVKLKSEAFNASIQLNRLHVQSVNPKWQPADLRYTTVRDRDRGEILLFKLIDWQTIRIEACASNDTNSVKLTPIRLITNQGKVRITMKKRESDSSLVASRLMLVMDDLLWVLTDLQLKAAILFANSVSKYVEKASKYSKMKAGEKVQKSTLPAMAYKQQHSNTATGARNPQQQQQQQQGPAPVAASIFDRLDVIESSFHLIISRLDLHLCDDFSPSPSDKHNTRIQDGAMQMTFMKMFLDYYPYHLAGGDRSHWYRYGAFDTRQAREQWSSKLYSDFKQRVRATKNALDARADHMSKAPDVLLSPNAEISPPPRPPPNGVGNAASSAPPSVRVSRQPTRLLESVFVFRLEDFVVFCVSSAESKRATPRKLISSDKKRLFLPDDMSSVHAEFSEFYFPEGMDFPVPNKHLYTSVAPLRICADFSTLMWVNSYLLNLYKDIKIPIPEGSKEHVDIRVEAVMPKIVMPAADTESSADASPCVHPDRPTSLQLQIAKVVLTNVRIEPGAGLDDLSAHVLKVASLQNGALDVSSGGAEFPSDAADLEALPKFWSDYLKTSSPGSLRVNAVPSPPPVTGDLLGDAFVPSNGLNVLHTNSLKQLADEDVWSISLSQVWADFTGIKSYRGGRLPFVDAFSATVWASRPTRDCFSTGEILFDAQLQQQQPRNIQNKNLIHDGAAVLNGERILDAGVALNGFSGANPFKASSHSLHDAPVLSGPKSSSSSSSSDSLPRVSAIFACDQTISTQLDHFQYLFLLRLVDEVTDMQKQVESDILRITGQSPADDVQGAQTVSLVSILPAVDVFLLHPPVVVNGGTHPPASTAATPSAAAPAASTNGVGFNRIGAVLNEDSLPPATPDQIATPDVMSPEGRKTDVEGSDNGNFAEPRVRTVSAPMDARSMHVQVEGQVELPATPTISRTQSFTSSASPGSIPPPAPAILLDALVDVAEELDGSDRSSSPLDGVGLTPDSFNDSALSPSPASNTLVLPPSPLSNSTTPPNLAPTSFKQLQHQEQQQQKQPQQNVTPPSSLPLSGTPSSSSPASSPRPRRSQTINDDKRNSISSLPDSVGDTLARSKRTFTTAVTNPLDSAKELTNKSGKVLDSAFSKSTSAFTKSFLSVGGGLDSANKGANAAGSGPASNTSNALTKGFSDLNKGFSSMGSSINKFGTTLKNNTVGKIAEDEHDDSWTEVSSMHSDSDDSDMVMVGMDDTIDAASLGGASDAFGSTDPLDELAASHPAPVEEGSEAVDDAAGDEDEDSISTSFSTASTRSKEKISIVNLKVPSGGQLVFQLQPRGSIAAKMLVPSLDIIVKKTLAFEEFQSSFGKSKSHCGDSRAEACIPSAFPVSLRFSAGPSAEALCPGAAETGFLSVVVSGMSLALPVSAATALADMFEDEVFPPPFPMNVRVERLAFKMVPDLPPLHPTSPGPVELDLFVDSTSLYRGLDGVFRVNDGSGPGLGANSGVVQAVSNAEIKDSNKTSATSEREQLFTKLENAKLKQNEEQLLEELRTLKKAAKAAASKTPAVSSAAGSRSAPALNSQADSVSEIGPAKVQPEAETSPTRLHRKLTRLSHNSHQDSLDVQSNSGETIQTMEVTQPKSEEVKQQQLEEDKLIIRLDEMTEENSSLKGVLKDALDRLAQAEQHQQLLQSQQQPEVVRQCDSVTSVAVEKENLSLKKQLDETKEEVSHLNQEKNSLLATLQLLQEELLRSEHMRGRSSTTS